MRSQSDHDPALPANWRVLRQLWPYLRENRDRVLLALGCLVLAKGAVIAIPFLLKALVDTLDSARESGLGGGLLVALVVAYGAARFANTFFGELRDTIFGRVTERAMRRINLSAFRHVHSLDLAFHLERRTGGLARDIERGVTGVSFLLRFFVFNIAPTLFEIAMVAGILLVGYGWEFALITVVSVLAYGLFSVRATHWRTRFVREMNEADSASNTRAVDSLLNFETVKYFTNETFEADRYDRELARWEAARRRNRLSLFGLNAGQALIIALAQTAMIALAVRGVSRGELTLGDFILINQFMLQLFMPLGFLGFVYREIKGSLANIESLFRLLERRPTITEPDRAPALHCTAGSITFSGISFSYDAARPILEDVSFTVPAGHKVAVVGASGAGKSTLVKLLFRFYDPQQGQILIDGQDIADTSLHSLRAAIGIVPQDTVLFNDSMLENIRYGRPAASDAEVLTAAHHAHLGDLLERLPQGIHTRVGERGLKLSGGEKQRVAIARTILKRPPILVFDEATSSLDSRSEQSILQALRELAQNHTSLVIAHRLSTVIDADSIIVLHHGRIVEQGTHAALLTRGGHYAALWAAQRSAQTPLPDDDKDST